MLAVTPGVVWEQGGERRGERSCLRGRPGPWGSPSRAGGRIRALLEATSSFVPVKVSVGLCQEGWEVGPAVQGAVSGPASSPSQNWREGGPRSVPLSWFFRWEVWTRAGGAGGAQQQWGRCLLRRCGELPPCRPPAWAGVGGAARRAGRVSQELVAPGSAQGVSRPVCTEDRGKRWNTCGREALATKNTLPSTQQQTPDDPSAGLRVPRDLDSEGRCNP